jgi:Raf kinase inhibitor-like YbhB/YbcL family protein
MFSVQRWTIPLALGTLMAALAATPQAAAQYVPMVLKSPEFANGSILPLSTINDIPANGVNSCTANGAAGGDTSPALTWSSVPPGTKSFVLVLFDTVASFTHWGIYNIPSTTRSLPANAGASVSGTYGTQILDDGGVEGYFGPCPPANYPPNNHQYVFTLFALNTTLSLPNSADFPADSETLGAALLTSSLGGHVLGIATLTGYYSATPNN